VRSDASGPGVQDGDRAAVLEMWHCLAEDGLLLLAVPTCAKDTLYWPMHRVYGPVRLLSLLRNFSLLGRVWNSSVVRGGLEAAASTPSLWQENCRNWQHQQVLILQKTTWQDQQHIK
jgi:hypothetical protein